MLIIIPVNIINIKNEKKKYNLNNKHDKNKYNFDQNLLIYFV